VSDYLRLIVRKALLSGDPALLQASFEVAVLERYLGSEAYSVIRTETVGRLRKQGAWSIDFGIAPGETTIHASWHALMFALPEEERAHWANHTAATLALSAMFLQMQLSPNSCHDDGELRPWGS